jgi:hypothetical protein
MCGFSGCERGVSGSLLRVLRFSAAGFQVRRSHTAIITSAGYEVVFAGYQVLAAGMAH